MISTHGADDDLDHLDVSASLSTPFSLDELRAAVEAGLAADWSR